MAGTDTQAAETAFVRLQRSEKASCVCVDTYHCDWRRGYVWRVEVRVRRKRSPAFIFSWACSQVMSIRTRMMSEQLRITALKVIRARTSPG